LKHRLIVAMCVYNEEQFIDKTIDSLLAKVKDVDVIEILDGAWKNGGEFSRSTDKTEEIVNQVSLKHHNRCDIVFRATDTIFENEAAKRNHQLEIIEDEYGYEKYSVLVFDADERVSFTTGQFEVWVKDYVGDLPFIGCLKTYAYSSKKPMYIPRLFPGGHGIHYHNQRSMIVHTGDHSIGIDYNVVMQQRTFGPWFVGQSLSLKIFEIKDFFIVNYWPTRSKERILEKLAYNKFQEEIEHKNITPCNYQQKIRGTDEEEITV